MLPPHLIYHSDHTPIATSLVLKPQKSQTKDMMITSLKYGMSVTHMRLSPILPHAWQGTYITII